MEEVSQDVLDPVEEEEDVLNHVEEDVDLAEEEDLLNLVEEEDVLRLVGKANEVEGEVMAEVEMNVMVDLL